MANSGGPQSVRARPTPAGCGTVRTDRANGANGANIELQPLTPFMDTPTPPDGIPLKDWIAAAPIGKTATYALLEALGLTPDRAVFPGYPRPVPFLTPEQQNTLDAAARAVANGRTVASIAAEVAGSSGEIAPAAPAALAAPAAGALAQPEAIAALVAAFAQAMPPQAAEPDPLRVAERLNRAAELGAWLSTGELAEVLGVHRTAPDPVAWLEKFPRPGYRVEAVKHGRGWFWRVSHDGPIAPVRSLAAADRPVGFGALLEASAVTLERRASMIGGPQLPSLPRAWS